MSISFPSNVKSYCFTFFRFGVCLLVFLKLARGKVKDGELGF